jgi:hypothetical protein
MYKYLQKNKEANPKKTGTWTVRAER